MTGTYLSVQFRERDTVKALGARFDWDTKQWFVPAGRDLAPFTSWLPERAESGDALRDLVAVEPSASGLKASPKGVPLSRLLSGVAAAVTQAYKSGVWTTAEVLQAREVRGNWFLELAERLPDGQVVAKSNAVIWSRNAPSLIASFQRETGAALDAGIKVLLRAKPTFSSEHGFILVLDAIDASYTLGDLEAKKRDIRARLQREGLYARNKALPAPWDYAQLLVVSPAEGAGLGDFMKEAERLASHGLLRTVYTYCRFQGDAAAGELRTALQDALQSWGFKSPPDAVVIIRGGGAVNDLAWLNDYELARFICDCAVPVLTGIGHERDSTMLDEVAHQKFDTPSKVIAGIEQHLCSRARAADAHFEEVIARAGRDLERASASSARLDEQVRALSLSTLTGGRSKVDDLLNACRLGAVRNLHRSDAEVEQRLAHIKAGAVEQLSLAKRRVPANLAAIGAAAGSRLIKVKVTVDAMLPALLQRATADVARASQAASAALGAVFERSRCSVWTAADGCEALMREIAGQGPQKTVERGFAIARTVDGRTITSAAQAPQDAAIKLTFCDGVVSARVDHIENLNRPNESGVC